MRGSVDELRSVAHGVIRKSVKLFNRNPWTNERLLLVPKPRGRWYGSDGLWTEHAQPFLDDPAFQRSYGRACQAADAYIGLEWRLHTVLWAAGQCASLDGSFVECGTARGFMASGICEFLRWTDRPFYLLDTFAANMPTTDAAQDGIRCAFYADGPEAVGANFAEWPGVRLVVGRVPDSLTKVLIGKVAFLHVDMNHPEPEAAAVRHFWPELSVGGIIIFDDYGFPGYEASRESADRLGRELGFDILCLPTGQGLVVKRS